MYRQWRLGKDISTYDNLLDEVTFDQLILSVHCNCREITKETVRKEWIEIINERLSDARFLFENNIDKIIEEANKRRD